MLRDCVESAVQWILVIESLELNGAGEWGGGEGGGGEVWGCGGGKKREETSKVASEIAGGPKLLPPEKMDR